MVEKAGPLLLKGLSASSSWARSPPLWPRGAPAEYSLSSATVLHRTLVRELPSERSSNVVLSLAVHAQNLQLLPFCATLRAVLPTTRDAEAVLFVSREDSAERERFCAHFGVFCITVPPKGNKLKHTFERYVYKLAVVESKEINPGWKNYLFLDATDIYFQVDPFGPLAATSNHPTLFLAREEHWKTLRADFYHQRWLECQGGGKSVWEHVSGAAPLLNSGTVGVTTREGALAFLRHFVGVLLRVQDEIRSQPGWCSADQGVLNLIAYSNHSAYSLRRAAPMLQQQHYLSIVNDRHQITLIDEHSGMWLNVMGCDVEGRLRQLDDPVDRSRKIYAYAKACPASTPAAIVHHWARANLPPLPRHASAQAMCLALCNSTIACTSRTPANCPGLLDLAM